MVEKPIADILKQYLIALSAVGIHAKRAILFGSFARNEAHEWSDIDVIVIAPEFDEIHEIGLVKRMWRATLAADKRIEPIPCGEHEWETDGGSPILEIARREGIEIAA
ncbi:MAG: nucleotidyltransferase domain-containing protein [Candidatus Sumerlaeota bacterium]|nr:nucleotidyltransferase domain-containing protein [Candidatus Sumerlaeota bacterium]